MSLRREDRLLGQAPQQPARPWAEVAADFDTVQKLLHDAAAQFPPGRVPLALECSVEALAALRKEWSARG